MGWRDFQETPQREFMELMESIKLDSPLIPLIPLIPHSTISENGSVSALPTLNKQTSPEKCICLPKHHKPDTISAFCPKYVGHCSVKIGDNYPAECIAIDCEYHGLPGVPMKRGVYKLADYCHEPADKTTQHTVCPCCSGIDFWQSTVQENHSVCRRCHPPSPRAERIHHYT